jgi:hypothetical protein
MLETISDLLRSKKIPPLDAVQMSDLLHHVFAVTDEQLRFDIGEVAYRYDHNHPNAFDLFLACTLPLAKKAAHRKANKLFVYASDWQIELMYDGAVAAVIDVFQRNVTLNPTPNAFRRYLLRALYCGMLRAYFARQENSHIRAVGDVKAIRTQRRPFRNTVEEEIIARELLEQVTNFPHSYPPVRATLQCIAALGPDFALKEHPYRADGDPDKWERQRRRRPILDVEAIAEAMGLERRDVHRNLRQARIALRNVFNADGRLFLTH